MNKVLGIVSCCSGVIIVTFSVRWIFIVWVYIEGSRWYPIRGVFFFVQITSSFHGNMECMYDCFVISAMWVWEETCVWDGIDTQCSPFDSTNPCFFVHGTGFDVTVGIKQYRNTFYVKCIRRNTMDIYCYWNFSCLCLASSIIRPCC